MHGSLATRLRVLRAERGLTVRQVAELSGVAKETISQVERGERHPYDRTLAKLAHAYGVPIEDLLEEPVLAGPKADAPQAGATPHPFEDMTDPGVVLEWLHYHKIPASRSEATVLAQYLELRERPPSFAGPVAVGYVRKFGEEVDHERVKTMLAYALEAGLLDGRTTALSEALRAELAVT
jgi:transcriptional regulator with XRE-family HTH domain